MLTQLMSFSALSSSYGLQVPRAAVSLCRRNSRELQSLCHRLVLLINSRVTLRLDSPGTCGLAPSFPLC